MTFRSVGLALTSRHPIFAAAHLISRIQDLAVRSKVDGPFTYITVYFRTFGPSSCITSGRPLWLIGIVHFDQFGSSTFELSHLKGSKLWSPQKKLQGLVLDAFLGRILWFCRIWSGSGSDEQFWPNNFYGTKVHVTLDDLIVQIIFKKLQFCS